MTRSTERNLPSWGSYSRAPRWVTPIGWVTPPTNPCEPGQEAWVPRGLPNGSLTRTTAPSRYRVVPLGSLVSSRSVSASYWLVVTLDPTVTVDSLPCGVHVSVWVPPGPGRLMVLPAG